MPALCANKKNPFRREMARCRYRKLSYRRNERRVFPHAKDFATLTEELGWGWTE